MRESRLKNRYKSTVKIPTVYRLPSPFTDAFTLLIQIPIHKLWNSAPRYDARFCKGEIVPDSIVEKWIKMRRRKFDLLKLILRRDFLCEGEIFMIFSRLLLRRDSQLFAVFFCLGGRYVRFHVREMIFHIRMKMYIYVHDTSVWEFFFSLCISKTICMLYFYVTHI